MIKKVIVVNNLGESLALELSNPWKTGIYIKSIEGIGPTRASINTTDLASNDGSVFNSARLTERNIVITLGFLLVPGITNTIEDARQLTYKYFPNKKPITFYILTDNREVYIEGYVESNDPDIFSKEETTMISIICPNPNFYSIYNNRTVFSGIDSQFEFPWSNESFQPDTVFGDILIVKERNIYYNGDVDTGINIKLHFIGSVTNVNIYHTNNREIMRILSSKIEALTGSGIVYGDDIYINTNKGNKSISLVRQGTTYNILNALDKNPDWFTISKGDNTFVYTTEYGSENVQLTIVNDVAFEGV